MFSKRTGWSRTPNRLSELVASVRGELLDLTESNPTRAGFDVPALVARLGEARGARYRPDPRGVPEAREAIARHYASRGIVVPPDRIVLCASTSEAYGWLFKLLCDPGDRVLVPAPSYPLLPFLAELDDVVLASYPLLRDEGWRIDTSAVASRLGEGRTRAIALVHPGNPTGTFTRRDEAASLAKLAREHDAALIVDEVFADYAHGSLPGDRLPGFAGGTEALTFVMSGLSKVALTPQLKLGWIVVAGGDATMQREALERLEVIADSYLSVATPVQLALPEILAEVPTLQVAVTRRLLANRTALDRAIAGQGSESPLRRLTTDGGWYALVEIPRTRSDDEWLARAIEAGVLVHPGYFFDMPTSGVMVVSLLTDERVFAEGIARLAPIWSAG